MIINMKCVGFICMICCPLVVRSHLEGKHGSKCSNFDSVLGVMEESARLRVELAELKKLFEQEIAQQRNPMAFCASVPGDLNPGEGDILKYQNVDYNDGSMYHASSGMVIIKEEGFYTFHVQFCAQFEKAAVVGLKVNDVLLKKSTSYENELSSCNTLMFSSCLEEGDTVMLVNPYQYTYFKEDNLRSNQFCGYRVNKQVCVNMD